MKRLLTFVMVLAVFGCRTNSQRLDTCTGTEVFAQGFSPPLVSAAANGDLARVRALLASGADPNAQDCDDMDDGKGKRYKELSFTPLMLAVGHGHIEVAQLLIDSGANPRQKTSDGRDAMTFAVESGRGEAIAFMRRVLAMPAN